MTESHESRQGVEVDIGKAVVAQEEPVSTTRKGRGERSWAAMVLTTIIVSVLCSVAALAVYDRYFAQKVVTANIAKFVLDQRDLYFEGKIDREQYVTNLNNFVTLLKNQPKNRVVILEDVVAANGEKLEPR